MERLLSPRVGFGLVAALYLLSFPYHPGLRSPNELCRLFQSRAIVDFHELSLNHVLQQQGGVGDLSCAARFQVGATEVLAPCLQPPPGGVMKAAWYYPSKAPLMSVLGVPVYWALKTLHGPVTELGQVYFSRLFLTVLPTLALLWMLRRVLREYLPGVADVLVVAYAVGTNAFSYAEAFMSHQLTAVLLFGTFFAGWKVLRREWGAGGWALAGALAGLAVTGEYTAALTVLGLAVWVVVSTWGRWKELGLAVVLVVLGASPFLGGLLWYHAVLYGHPLESGYRWLNDSGYQHWHVGGFLGIGGPHLDWFLLSFFSPLRGFFTLSPFLALSLVGLNRLRQRDTSLFVLSTVLLLANAYFTSAFDYTSWGWTVGPRHLVPLVPFLLLPAGYGLDALRTWGAGARAVGYGLMASSVLVTGLAVSVNYIPADVSTSVFGLTVPMLQSGLYPVSVLTAFGLPNPAAGLMLLGLLLACVAWVLGQGALKRFGVGIMLAVVVAHLGSLKLATKDDDHDQGARKFLGEVWLAPVGKTFSLFGP